MPRLLASPRGAIGLWALLVLVSPEARCERCPPFPPPAAGDAIVRVSPDQVIELPGLVRAAAPHTTILLEEGVYALRAPLVFHQPHVTLRSASGRRDAVVLDGGYREGAAELVFINAEQVTIADLTLRRAWNHPVHVVGGGDSVTLYNLKIQDGRQQFVKVNGSRGKYADFGTAACCLLELTPAGRAFVHQNPTPGFDCYTGGFDLLETRGWVIRDSVIRDIYCTNGGLAQHAIHLFQSNRDPVVERNLVLDNARGIGFGLGRHAFRRRFADDPFAGTEMEGRESEVMQIGGVIRNNIVFAAIGRHYDVGIGLESAWGAEVVHNTVYSEMGSFNAAIDVRFPGSEGVVLANNLFYPRIVVRNGAPRPKQVGNVRASAEMFADLRGADLHLRRTAIRAVDRGVSWDLAADLDDDLRDARPDVGADEWVAERPPEPPSSRD